MIQRILIGALLLVLSSSLIFAEGSQETGEQSLELRFSFWGDQAEKKTVEGALQAFTDTTGIPVDPLHIPTDYDTKLITLLAANDPPHSGYLAAPRSFDLWGEGKLSNLMPYIEADPEVTVETWIKTNYFWVDSETIIGVSGDLQTYVIYYNKDLFDAAGIEYPPTRNADAWTWDEFIAIAKQLTLDSNGNNAAHPDFDPENIVQYGAQMPLWSDPIEALLVRNGTSTIVHRGTALGLTEPEGYEVLQALADAMNVHHVMPTPIAAQGLPNGIVSLQTGKYAMFLHGHWENNQFRQVSDSLNWDVGVLPYFTTKNTVTGNAARVMFTDAGDSEETWALMKFLADPAGGIDLFRSGLWAPSKLDWYTDPEKVALWAENNPGHSKSYKEVFFPIFMNAEQQVPGLYVKNFDEINSVISSALDLVWSGEKSAKDAIMEIVPEVEPLFQGAYGWE